ncbi:hypothetical protein KM043_007887 [Ampulex compressa]|nr:hypothetical protein KM043_007887 [Ampulex compressa]
MKLSRTDGEEMHARSASALAHEGDVVGITAEEGDVLLHPVKGRYLVHQAVIRDPGLSLRRHVGVQESEDPEAVVHRYDHLFGVAGKDAAVVWISTAPVVALPVDVEQHRMPATALRHA